MRHLESLKSRPDSQWQDYLSHNSSPLLFLVWSQTTQVAENRNMELRTPEERPEQVRKHLKRKWRKHYFVLHYAFLNIYWIYSLTFMKIKLQMQCRILKEWLIKCKDFKEFHSRVINTKAPIFDIFSFEVVYLRRLTQTQIMNNAGLELDSCI